MRAADRRIDRRHTSMTAACLLAVLLGALTAGRPAAAAPPFPKAERSPVVLSEIMYHPPAERDELQFVEVHNVGTNEIDLAGWSLAKGIDFVFPRGARLSPDSHAVLCRDFAAFKAAYGESVQPAGVFAGRLSHQGESIELRDPQGRTVDSVRYDDRPPWPTMPDGHGASLERICPAGAGDDPLNWCASEPNAAAHPGGTPGRRNASFSPLPLPRIEETRPAMAEPDRPIPVLGVMSDETGIESATVVWQAWSADGSTVGGEVSLTLTTGDARRGTYQGQLPPQPEGRLIRYYYVARNGSGASRRHPSATDRRPTLTCTTLVNTNTAQIPFLQALTFKRVPNGPPPRRVQGVTGLSNRPAGLPGPEWNNAVIVLPPRTNAVLVFDYVQVRSRRGGFKIHFLSEEPWDNLAAINLLFESSPRYALSEPLAYELFRRAGVPTPRTGHVRLWLDRRPLGYHLLVEQPNRPFLRRQGRDPDGNVYKLGWYGQGVVGQHERKGNPGGDYSDLLSAVNGLNRTRGPAQWDFIRQHFQVDELASYFAVNMCIQNWDGFFNNYFAYHDPRPGGKWELVPWDLDKTWGDYDGASPEYDWYELPLTYGMNGAPPPQRSWFGMWPIRGAEWWRPPGYFSGPLLANPEFRQCFLARLRELCDTAFTPEQLDPFLAGLKTNLEPEIPIRAQLQRHDPGVALRRFYHDLESLHRQIQNRRDAILAELALAPPP